MLFLTNLLLYLAIFLPLTCVLGLMEGAVRGMWAFNPAELQYQAGAWAVFEAPGLLLVAVPVVLVLGWLVHLLGRGKDARRRRMLAAVLAPLLVWLGGLVLGPFGGQLLLAFPFAWIASGIIYGLVFKLSSSDVPSSSSDPAMRASAPLLLLFSLSLPSSPVCAQENPNMLTAKEEQEGWRLLFDGSTTNGWRGFKQTGVPDGWKVIEGAITRVGEGEDLITNDEFANFELALQWKIAPGGNSGIMYRVTEDADATYETGPEMQVLDDAKHPDGKSRLTAAGSCFGIYPSPAGHLKPIGEWNSVRIVVNGNHVEHWLNGTKVVEYELGSADWEAKVKASKFAQWAGYGRAPSGHIAIQNHGDRVAYRGIKVKVLP
jgi:3-keto-disaccharide hydrolase